jgi:hypothetical protein
MIQVLRGYVAAHQQRATETISIENLFVDVHRQLTAWSVLTESGIPLPAPAVRGLPELAARLSALLASQWHDRWIKASNKKRRPHAANPRDRTHGAVFRILQAAASRAKA